MKEWNADRAKGYPLTDTSERNAIALFEYLINKKRIKGKVEVSDKNPSIDGTLALYDEEGKEPLSKIEIQIKSRPSDIINLKSQLELSLFHYAIYKTNNPVFFIGVDSENEQIYWLYLTKELLESRKKPIKVGQKTVLINLKLNDIFDGLIDKENEKYIERWINLSRSHYSRLPGYIELKKKYQELLDNVDITLKPGPEIEYINIFMGQINKLLKDFKIVKKRFYPGSVRMGFAYYKFLKNELAYTVYPIFNENSPNIKIIHEESLEQIIHGPSNLSDFFSIHYQSNPIIENPKGFATDFIKERVDTILTDTFLGNYNEFLANEFVYAFTEKYRRLLGLQDESTYSTDKIKESFEKSDKTSLDELIRSSKISLNIYLDLLQYMDSKGIKTVNNVYLDNYEIFQDKSGIWGEPSFENITDNWNTITENVYDVYNDLINLNFPNIKNDLQIFKGSKNILFTLFPYDEDRYGPGCSTYRIVGFDKEENEDFNINFKLYGDGDDPKVNLKEKLIEIDGETFDINYWKYNGYFFTGFDYMPMINFVYELIQESIDKYFKNLISVK